MDTMTGQREMVLVPRNPTPAMLKAAWADALGEDAAGVWDSMVQEWIRSTAVGIRQGEEAADLAS